MGFWGLGTKVKAGKRGFRFEVGLGTVAQIRQDQYRSLHPNREASCFAVTVLEHWRL